MYSVEAVETSSLNIQASFVPMRTILIILLTKTTLAKFVLSALTTIDLLSFMIVEDLSVALAMGSKI